MILKGYLFSVLYALICLALAFLLYKLGVTKKITRKIVHILVGFEWVILYHFHGASIHFLAVCLLFLAILAFSHRKNLMPMISSDGDNAPGTVYYAVAMSIMATVCLFLPLMILPFGIGVFCTSFGDGFAGLFGQLMSFPRNAKIYGNKTIYGTLLNFIICGLTAGVFNSEFGLGMQNWQILAIALFATELDLFTGKALDNISITLGTSFLSYFFINFPDSWNYVIPILITPLIIVLSYKKRALTVSGIIAALIVDIFISIPLGNFGFCILLSFFAGGILVDKINKSYKKSRQKADSAIEKRGACRDHVQVLANSLVASACAVLYAFTDEKVLVVAFVASLAEAFADTAASGIGVLSGSAYDLCRMRPCTPGVSGGISLLGTVSSVAAAILVSLVALAFGRITFIEALIIFTSATLGAIFDSLLGSLLQIKFKCAVCGTIVEREEHCGKPTVRHSGLRFVNNDCVNLLGTLFAAVIAGLLFNILM